MTDPENSEFKDRVVIITGAGQGLGHAYAIEFARRGAAVVVNDLGAAVDGRGEGDEAQRVVDEIVAFGGRAIANRGSVSDRAGAMSVVDDAVSEFGRVDVLVNNAGILRADLFENSKLDDWERVVQVHLNGSAYVTHAAWPLMNAQGYGRIVLTGSGAGIYGVARQSSYGAAKMGLIGLMNVLAAEGEPNNVRINTIAPRASTRMVDAYAGRVFDAAAQAEIAAPGLVSPAVLYLASSEAPNGVVIHAGGGEYYRSRTFVNEPVDLGTSATFEQLKERATDLLDMSSPLPPPRGSS